MRVDGARKGSYMRPAAPARATGGGFAVPEASAAPAAAPAAPSRGVASLGALMALQSFEGPGERRRRAIGRGRTALDALEAIKLGLLAGTLDAAAVLRLKSAASAMGETSGDPRLDSVLAEVELRAAVELAKLSRHPEPGGAR